VKLDAERAQQIRELENTGLSANAVGRQFGVNHTTILAIWRGITWVNTT
jgi:DNA invertase Pin-like site-specific DNA recombinase